MEECRSSALRVSVCRTRSASLAVGGWAFTISAGSISHVIGNAAGGAGSVLRTEGVIGPLTQNSFESFFGMSNSGQLSYSASSEDTMTTGLDGVWLDDAVIAIENMAVPNMPGMFFTFASRPGVTRDGTPYFVGGITDTPGGVTQQRVLFYGDVPAAVLAAGKRAFYKQLDMSMTDAYEFAGTEMARGMMLPEAAEGIDAFIEKRPAPWRQ